MRPGGSAVACVRSGAGLTLLIALLVAACGQSQAQDPKRAPVEVKPVAVTVARVEARSIQRSVETVGSLLAWEEVQVKSELAGTLTRLLVDLGDHVAAGAVLAEFDKREARLTADQAEADLLAAREGLARARAAVEASRANLARVKDQITMLQADVTRARAQLDWAALELERNRQLVAKELIAARDLDHARTQHQVAAAQLRMTETALNQHPDQVRIGQAQLESDLAALKVAEAQVKQREASLDLARKRLADTTVRAPLASLIARRHVSPGEYVRENTALFTLVVADPLKYTGTIPERFAPEVRPGQPLQLSVEAFPDRTFGGQVTRVSPAVDVQTRTLALEARVPNPNGRLRPGFFAKGVALTRKDDGAAFVPAEAVTYFVGISKIFVVADGKVQERQVRTGGRQGGWVEILEGVKPGETVATGNLSQLFNGAPVTVTSGKAGGS
ncbi:MAG: efflux RND transporter periplasmic adaptor subunit [Candidatus Rokubacteria bacterium]|nr:efflux RND transporter periplasmic adaptor subunit [Candidatus Rokubacteria bacterium]